MPLGESERQPGAAAWSDGPERQRTVFPGGAAPLDPERNPTGEILDAATYLVTLARRHGKVRGGA